MKCRSWPRGTPVRVTLDAGVEVLGQVWADAPNDGDVWLAMDDGTFLLARATASRVAAVEVDGRRVGTVAA